MAVDSSEIPYDQDVVDPKPKGEMTPLNKLAVTSAKVAGKGAIGLGRFGGNRLLDILRLGRKHKGFVAGALGGAATMGAAMAPSQAVDISKNVVSGSVDAIHNPKRTAGDATTEAGQVLLDAANAAVSKARQVSGLESAKNSDEKDADLPAVVSFYWPGASEEDRQKIETNVSVMHDYYVGTPDQAPLLPAETYEILASKKDLIEEKCVAAPWLANAVVGLAVAESRGGVDGKLQNMTKAGALGPFMMTEDFIREHGYEPTNDENDPRLSWEITVPIVVSELIRKTEHYGGNLGFAIWSWHRGEKAVDDDIIQLAIQRGLPTDIPIAQLVHDHNITEFDLEEDEKIKQELNQPDMDNTVIFVLRNAAGALVWVHVQQLAGKMQSDDEGQGPSVKIVDPPQETQEKAA